MIITLENLLKVGNNGKGYKIEEVPSSVIDNIKKYIPILQEIQNLWGKEFKFSSVYRSPEHNATIKDAAKQSGHMRGVCFDIVDSQEQDFAKWLMERLSLLTKYGIWIEHPAYTCGKITNWVHIGFEKKSVRAFKPKADSVPNSKIFNGTEQPQDIIKLDNKINENTEVKNNDGVMQKAKDIALNVGDKILQNIPGVNIGYNIIKGAFAKNEAPIQEFNSEQILELEKEKENTIQAQEATKQIELQNASKFMCLLENILSKAKDTNEIVALIAKIYKNAYITLSIMSVVCLLLLHYNQYFFFDDAMKHTLSIAIACAMTLGFILPIIPFALAYPPISKIVDALTGSIVKFASLPGKAVGTIEFVADTGKKIVNKIIK